MALSKITSSSITDTAIHGRRNLIINGAMQIDQRNSGASVTPASGNYTLDRFQAFSSAASKYSVQKNAGSVTPPVGFTNYLGVTSLAATSVAAGDYYMFEHKIEGFNISNLAWGTANAKAVTLSFQVYSSLTGTFGGSVLNSASNRSYPFTYSVASANTWTTVAVTIPGDTSGTWLTNNGVGLYISFSLGMGSTYSGTAGLWAGAQYWSASGATSIVGTSGATLYITGVQLEVGSQATPFEHRSYGEELALCQRYFYNAAEGNDANEILCGSQGHAENTTRVDFILSNPVPMRTSPSITKIANFLFRENGSNRDVTSISAGNTQISKVWVLGTTSGHTDEATGRIYTNGTNVGITVDAEL